MCAANRNIVARTAQLEAKATIQRQLGKGNNKTFWTCLFLGSQNVYLWPLLNAPADIKVENAFLRHQQKHGKCLPAAATAAAAS